MNLRPRLFHKLFAAIVIASFGSIVLFGAVAHWSMKRSFARYLNEARNERLDMLAARLATDYDPAQGFARLRDTPRAWRRLLRSLRDDAGPETGGPQLLPDRARHAFKLARHITLYDAERHIVAGRLPFGEATTTRPVSVDGRVVGWLGVPSLGPPGDARDRRFERRQMALLLIAALAAAVLAIPAAWWMARRLVLPIRRLGGAARALAEGDFAARVPTAGSDELGQLAQDFNLLARALEENESARRRWFADVSHELRTPLSILAGEIEAARDGVRALDMRLLDSLGAESERLGQLVEDLYLLARADIGALDFEFAPVSFADLVTQALVRFEHRLAAAGLTVGRELDAGCVVIGDRQRLAQLLENLLENCCRYVTAPGHIELTLGSVGGYARLVIEDSGPGVAHGEQARLFDPLHRGEASRSRRHGGSGLGLAICARIAHAHGGSITARAGARGGLAVVVDIPLGEHA